MQDRDMFAEFTTERERPDGKGTYLYFDRKAAEHKYGTARVALAIEASNRRMRHATN